MSRVTFTHLLAPTDFSAPSERAVGAAVELARAFHARLTLLHVLEADFESAALAYGLRPLLADYVEKSETAAIERLEITAGDITGLDISSLVKRGTPSVEIVRTARQELCDVIVMGMHGQSALRHMLFGSTAERVLRRSRCPVLAIPGVPDDVRETDEGDPRSTD